MSRREATLSGLTVVLLFALWEGGVRILDVPAFILPAPTHVIVRFVELFGTIADNSTTTLAAISVGYLVGTMGGLVLAIVMTLFPSIRAAIYPIVLATQTTPKIAVAPLFIIWFGVGLTPRVLIVALLAFFPVLINSVAGLTNIDKLQLDLMRSVHSNRWQIYRYIRIPNAIPYIFAGLKLALTVSIIGAIVAEWVASSSGLGYLLVFYIATLRTPDLFAVLLGLLVVATAAFGAIMLLERAFSWEAKIRGGESTAVVEQADAAM